MRQPDPRNAAAPTGKVEATNKSAGQLTRLKNTPAHKRPNYADAIDCPYTCSFDRRSCPWECVKLGGDSR